MKNENTDKHAKSWQRLIEIHEQLAQQIGAEVGHVHALLAEASDLAQHLHHSHGGTHQESH